MWLLTFASLGVVPSVARGLVAWVDSQILQGLPISSRLISVPTVGRARARVWWWSGPRTLLVAAANLRDFRGPRFLGTFFFYMPTQEPFWHRDSHQRQGTPRKSPVHPPLSLPLPECV